MIWWIIRIVGFASLGWFANTALDTFQESQANKELAEVAQVALEQAVIHHATRSDILSERLIDREAELQWARNQKANDELIKQTLRSENAELEETLAFMLDPRLAP